MAEWEIHKPLGTCSGSGKKIEPEEEYVATLVETPEGMQRKDYSIEYWSENKPEVYCYWKSVLPKPDQKKKLFIDDAMLMAFFERLATETDQEKLNFRFVLALVLMRKRLLKYDSSKTDNGCEIWILKVSGKDQIEQVINPHLTEDKIEQLSEQLGQILQVEFSG
ncbi:MAG: hypothetical protein A2Y10_12305 [Planctomycetes bacterium GWF2_41_51]|nr:MAG: hypothetical protein A2Y10_12305 [Planctomycetes bacterium GWF2_41_51]HBG26954.1 hypothetical protein [Phycisphaerales bacterium]